MTTPTTAMPEHLCVWTWGTRLVCTPRTISVLLVTIARLRRRQAVATA